MASYQGELVLNIWYYKAYFGTFQNGLSTGVATFQGSRLEEVLFDLPVFRVTYIDNMDPLLNLFDTIMCSCIDDLTPLYCSPF